MIKHLSRCHLSSNLWRWWPHYFTHSFIAHLKEKLLNLLELQIWHIYGWWTCSQHVQKRGVKDTIISNERFPLQVVVAMYCCFWWGTMQIAQTWQIVHLRSLADIETYIGEIVRTGRDGNNHQWSRISLLFNADERFCSMTSIFLKVWLPLWECASAVMSVQRVHVVLMVCFLLLSLSILPCLYHHLIKEYTNERCVTARLNTATFSSCVCPSIL